jgi:hypothetical protein
MQSSEAAWRLLSSPKQSKFGLETITAARENGNFVDKQKDGIRKVRVLVNIFGNQLDMSFCHFIV